MYEERIKELNQKLKDEHAHAGEIEEQLNSKEVLLREEHQNSVQVKSTFISLSLSLRISSTDREYKKLHSDEFIAAVTIKFNFYCLNIFYFAILGYCRERD